MGKRESVAPVRTGAAAEGATAPESLRPKDRRPTTLWKASSVAKAMEDHRRGKPSEALAEEGQSSQVPVTEGVRKVNARLPAPTRPNVAGDRT
jgi:hypothetical protein